MLGQHDEVRVIIGEQAVFFETHTCSSHILLLFAKILAHRERQDSP